MNFMGLEFAIYLYRSRGGIFNLVNQTIITLGIGRRGGQQQPLDLYKRGPQVAEKRGSK
jgi:hypothetical protein